VSFSADIQPIFTAHCTGCHSVTGIASFLVLNSGTYANLVDRPATRSPGTLVISGGGDAAAANSVLLNRVTGDLSPLLLRMPLGGVPLTTTELNFIRFWIIEGAKNN